VIGSMQQLAIGCGNSPCGSDSELSNAGTPRGVFWRSIISSLLVLTLVGCGGAHLDAKVAKRLAVAKGSRDPAY